MSARICRIPGCGKNAEKDRTMCWSHRERKRKLCEVAGCDQLTRPGRKVCFGHYARWRRYGDYFPDIPIGSVLSLPGVAERGGKQ